MRRRYKLQGYIRGSRKILVLLRQGLLGGSASYRFDDRKIEGQRPVWSSGISQLKHWDESSGSKTSVKDDPPYSHIPETHVSQMAMATVKYGHHTLC